MAVVQEGRQTRLGAAQVINPARRIDQDHPDAGLGRGIGFS